MTTRIARGAVLVAWLVASTAGTAWAQSGATKKIRYGKVISIERAIVEVKPTGGGAQAGATVGAVAGYALADGRDRWLGALVGGVLGGAAGRGADKAASKKKGWDIIILLEETGEEIGVSIPGKKQPAEEGNRVRLMTAANGQTSVKPV